MLKLKKGIKYVFDIRSVFDYDLTIHILYHSGISIRHIKKDELGKELKSVWVYEDGTSYIHSGYAVSESDYDEFIHIKLESSINYFLNNFK